MLATRITLPTGTILEADCKTPHDSYLELPTDEHPTSIDTYFLNTHDRVNPDTKRPCVLICPGGAYMKLSAREAEPVALKFMAEGMHAAVLHYSCAPHTYPLALKDLARAVAYLKHNADAFALDPDQIFVIGFSAGGHLAANLACACSSTEFAKGLGLKPDDITPKGVALIYPVITAGAFANADSIAALTGGDNSLLDTVSLQKQVTDAMPPIFMVHTLEDRSVPVQNSLLFAEALIAKKQSFELHIFPYGPHGIALGTQETAGVDKDGQIQPLFAQWPRLMLSWMRNL